MLTKVKNKIQPKDTEDLINKSKIIYGDMYDYSKTIYTNAKTKICFICNQHGEIFQLADTHLRGFKCKRCSSQKIANATRKSNADFITEANIIHNNLYDYTPTNYISARKYVDIICKEHGIFKQFAGQHIAGRGCDKCSRELSGKIRRDTTINFIKKAKEVHGELYDYSLVSYSQQSKRVLIICKKHEQFHQIANVHLQGAGCPRCSRRISKPSSLWIKSLDNDDIIIEHPLKENKNRKVDGYDPITNTVYQFHGAFYHCDPRKYDANKYDKMRKKTCGEVYANSCRLDQQIIDCGYNLIIMWECDWNIIVKENKRLLTKQ